MNKIDKIISYFRNLKEDGAPTNALVHGNIAGTTPAGDEPPVRRKQKRNVKYATGGRGSRKLWLNYFQSK